ncbi:MAG: phosphoribosyl-AMP cyclohydrolase [Clostridium sp.]|uniref:phosphoribosyl-AMP cyclohydrolase n=1 Tax=Clostridium TaxID=1485 RepID=UPI0021526CA6|nr:phosphoribosyl-AMP cyclohydrolase [Clostridium sp. LY3-2]MCR6515665.1 phosphoribosyl-AMP cyclohydrolase [Clostridium sp. LY3-2]
MIRLLDIDFDKGNGLVPCIIQDYKNLEVLMLGYMSKESLKKTLETKHTWFFSRSKNRLWNKGETSKNFQIVKNIKIDCDKDTILILVDQIGVACHTGKRSCFYRELEGGD